MNNKIVNFKTWKITSDEILDIIEVTRHYKTKGFKDEISIYWYSDNDKEDSIILENLELLKSFWYIKDYKVLEEWNIQKMWIINVDFWEEFKKWEEFYKFRKPKYFIFRNVDRWKFLEDNISWQDRFEKLDFFTDIESQKIVNKSFTAIKNNIKLLDDLIITLKKGYKKYIEYINKLDWDIKINYIEDILYFLSYKNKPFIDFLNKEILNGWLIKSIRIEWKNIYGRRWWREVPIMILNDNEKKLIKFLDWLPLTKKSIMNHLWYGKSLDKQEQSFKSFIRDFKKKRIQKQIDHLLVIKYEKWLYRLIINKPEGNL